MTTRALLLVTAHIEVCQVQLILALRFPSSSERLNGFFGFVERVFRYTSLILDSFDLLELFGFPFSVTDSPTPMNCCYCLNGARSKARSLVLSIPTFELSFGCLIVCDSFLIQSSLYPLLYLLSSYFPVRARLRKYYCRRFITFAESRVA